MNVSWTHPTTHGLNDEPSPDEDDGNKHTARRVNQANAIGGALIDEKNDDQADLEKQAYGFIDVDDEDALHQRVQNNEEHLKEKIRAVATMRHKPVPVKPRHADRHRISDTTDPNPPKAYRDRDSPAKQRLHRIRRHAQKQIMENTPTVYNNVSIKDDSQVTHRTPRKLSDVIGQAFRDKALAIGNDYTDKQSRQTIQAALRQDDYALLQETAEQARIQIKDADDTRLTTMKKTLMLINTRTAQDLFTDTPPLQEKIAMSEQTLHDDYDDEPRVLATERDTYFKQSILDPAERRAYERQGQWKPPGTIPDYKTQRIKRRFQQYEETQDT